jgi:hypothetical protein
MAKPTELTAVVVSKSATPSVDDIARRAYEIYLREGGVDGRHVEHWLQAERELLG